MTTSLDEKQKEKKNNKRSLKKKKNKQQPVDKYCTLRKDAGTESLTFLPFGDFFVTKPWILLQRKSD